jgi:hypothetical protein
MATDERRTWLLLIITIVTTSWYVITVLSRADGGSLVDTAYVGPMLTAIGVGIVAAIIVEIVLAIATAVATGEEPPPADERERQIKGRSAYIGQSLVIAGAVAALLMALADWDTFWIANVIYLAFAASAVLEMVAKLAFYRRGLPAW